jgi:phospholipid/cholesterol/gamma-HCH transport system ATP-binding protein
VLSLQKATLAYDSNEVLKNISLDIHQGEYVFIFGESSKTSLLKLMGGLEEPQTGSVLYGNNNLYAGSDYERSEMLRSTGHLFQNAALIANLSMFENVALPLRYHTKLKDEEIREKVQEVFSMLDIHIRHDQRPAVFTLGICKMVALARALVLNPDMLFLDDPTSGLEHGAREKMLRVLSAMRRRKDVTAVFVSQYMDIVRHLADRILVLYENTLIADDSAAAVLNSKDKRVHDIIAKMGSDDALKSESAQPGSSGNKGEV